MRGSNSKGNLESSATLQSELESLLLQQQRNRGLILERERELNINRSGSAPPTVEGSLNAARGLYSYPHIVKLDGGGGGGGSSNNNAAPAPAPAPTFCVLTEEEILSHPAYLEYYYSNENLNPRLPPPSLSREDWRIAQRFRAAGFNLDRNLMENVGNSSLFSTQPNLSVKKSEDDMLELRKAALRNLSRKSSVESLDKYLTGGASTSGMGGRRKSFADILQGGSGQPVKSNLSRPASQNSVADVLDSMANNPNTNNSLELRNKAEAERAFASSSSTTQNPSRGLVTIGNGVYLAENLNSMRGDSRNFPPPGIFEIADVEASLSGLSMSRGGNNYHNNPHAENILKSSLQMGIPLNQLQQQQYYGENSRAENMAHNINYGNLSRSNNGSNNSLNNMPNEGVNFPRRTSSTTSLHSQQQNHSDISSYRNSGYSVDQKPRMGISSDLSTDGLVLRPSVPPGIHLHVVDPHQIQYMQKIPNYGGGEPPHISGNSSRAMQYDELQALEKAYLEALLLQQAQQYQSQLLQRPGGIINHQYHAGPTFSSQQHSSSSSSSYQGNVVNSQDSRGSSKTPVLQKEKNTQLPPTSLRSPKGDQSTVTPHQQSGSSSKGRFESLLEVLKNNKAKSLDLSDIVGHVVEFSTDQFGSRFIQQKLETATVEEKTKILTEIIPNARALMIDVFGNYVVQKFFEHGIESQRKELATHIIGHVLPLTLQMYGCRVVQKALEVVDVELQTEMVKELDGSVLKCVHDQNGNHVIQKCIESVPQERIQFIISSFLGQVVTLSTHPYGCRVIQRVLEHCNDPKTQEVIMDEILGSVCKLAQDQYGNYVIQHVVQHGKPQERAVIIGKLAGQIVKMSQQKFASNVVEKCLTFGGAEERKLLVNEMLGSTDENEPLQAMMKDPFGNYVVQKVLETCDDKSRELILSRIKVHLNALKRYTYGKHIVSRIEKLVATGERHIGQSSRS
ncbi:hypothetical protein ABFS82_06G165300 [Erythranthe guttata]|uniref:pumilio homolog 4 n=1 Tax=Erythranthe guttata TaxID=4155 RepID=UPI00064DDCAC|nr:PREDICTED: pumilio homolog 4 [Erythranthe guttata]|eukprot:XP_012834949.1 PREDICTED: pumilio homolog 4 [Erythranthe guttata]